jgi:MFS family permease
MSTRASFFLSTVGAGALMFILVFLASEGNRNSFENPNAPLWANAFPLWGLLSFVVPGIFVGVVTNRHAARRGMGAGMVGCFCLALYVGFDWERCCTDPMFPPPYLQWLRMAAIYTACTATTAWLTASVVRRWSSNPRIERARER